MLKYRQGDKLHLKLRIRGGGGIYSKPPLEKRRTEIMSLAAGGKIRQVIARDISSKEVWDFERTIIFNVQLLDTTAFKSLTGLQAPASPITAATCEAKGIPFYKIEDEQPTGIAGAFGSLKSVNMLDKKTSATSPDGSLAAISRAANISTVHPLVVLKRTLRPFRHISDLENEAREFRQ